MRGTCVAVGEIDLATASAFGAAMCHAIDDADAHTVFVDCSAVTFMDSSAFHAFIAAHRYARSRSQQLRIRELKPDCARVLNLCDWDHELMIEC